MNRIVKMVAGASFGLFVGSFAAIGLAAEVGGVKLDDKMSLGGQEVVLNGQPVCFCMDRAGRAIKRDAVD